MQKLQDAVERFEKTYPESMFDLRVVNFEDLDLVQGIVTDIASACTIDIVMLAHGALVDDVECLRDIATFERALVVNASSHIAFINALHHRIEDNIPFRLVVIGSVAGDFGKKSNYIYGACKSFLETYLQGLQHKITHNRATHITLVKPGPTRTPMTDNAAIPHYCLANPRKVAQDIVNATERGKLNAYCPWYWRYIMRTLTLIPKQLLYKLMR